MKIPASPKRIDILDMRRRLGNDDGLIADLLGMFLEDCGHCLTSIESAVKTGDLSTVRRRAHSMKGSAANVSAVRVVDAAAALESSAEHGEVAELDPRLAKLHVELDELVTELGGIPPGRS